MAQPTEPTDSSEPVEVEAVEPTAPVSAAEHVGVDPVVPEVDDAEVVDDVERPVTVEPVVDDTVVEEPVVAQPTPPFVAEPLVAAPPASAPAASAAAAEAAAAREVVYVQAPTPPAPRQNRGFGVLISLLGAVAFALLYLGVAAIAFTLTPGTRIESTFSGFLASDVFWVPVAAYAVFSIVFALIVNRAAWWAHVVGSIFVAVLTYAVSLGVLALLHNVVAMTPDEAAVFFRSLAGNALMLAVLVLAREAALWFGLAISARGRRVKERNAADRAAFEQNVADRRAEYERAHPSA
ncbi:MAG: hypothetical protein M3Y46_08085 [Actinomycetota bacterium]|jgi:hypothetical protein|nr:hypothetical protein [Actinomycetota bacterium]